MIRCRLNTTVTWWNQDVPRTRTCEDGYHEPMPTLSSGLPPTLQYRLIHGRDILSHLIQHLYPFLEFHGFGIGLFWHSVGEGYFLFLGLGYEKAREQDLIRHDTLASARFGGSQHGSRPRTRLTTFTSPQVILLWCT